eukprot:5798729-Pyramimonas_sp.AAC.2
MNFFICLAPRGAVHPAKRVTHLLDGLGTLLHHSSAAMVICMLLVGVINRPVRAVPDVILPLVMQHWFAMVKYANRWVYVGIELVLEVVFEWSVFSNWENLYVLDWTCRHGALVMLCAHWLYLASAALALLAWDYFVDDMHGGGGTKAEKNSTGGLLRNGDMNTSPQWKQSIVYYQRSKRYLCRVPLKLLLEPQQPHNGVRVPLRLGLLQPLPPNVHVALHPQAVHVAQRHTHLRNAGSDVSYHLNAL